MNNSYFTKKNWEHDVTNVAIEPCDSGEDPSGFRAVFYLSEDRKEPISFTVGASTLAQRAKSLAMAGYNAPMTKKAISLLQDRLGGAAAVYA